MHKTKKAPIIVSIIGLGAAVTAWGIGGKALAQGETTAPEHQTAAPVVQTDKGRVRGVIEANGVLGYKGIPYAADSGGKNRFLPPKAMQAWPGVRDASAMGPACPQQDMIIGDRPQSEDCLRVSVWTKSLTGSRPVVVWLHGGAYIIGSDDYSAEGADGAFAAGSGDYVFISLTHRLNVLGFLQLGREFGPRYASSGNVGLLDLVAALTWVKSNVAKFGGDPGNVTIAGPSGGGSKVMHLMAMPQAKDLFQHGIVFVGSQLSARNTNEAAGRSGKAILDQLGVAPGDIGALRSIPFDALLQASEASEGGYLDLRPNIDGSVVPERPIDAIASGASRDVDLVVAVDQWTHWAPDRLLPNGSLYGAMTRADLEEALRPQLGDRTHDIVSRYEAIVPGASPSSLAALIHTDLNWWIPAIRLAEAKAKGGNPARVLFNSASPGAHSYFFGTNLTPAFSRALLGQVQGAYAAFARSGNPNHPGIPDWPTYTPAARNVLMLEYNVHVEQDPFKAERLIWKDPD